LGEAFAIVIQEMEEEGNATISLVVSMVKGLEKQLESRNLCDEKDLTSLSLLT
jgi:23S rRNA pseudoU1915 N3-methylase RlmH